MTPPTTAMGTEYVAPIVTRADGRPAYASAKPRLRQSHLSTLDQYRHRIAELRAEDRRLAELNGDAPDMNAIAGTAVLLGGAVMMMAGLYAVAWIFA